MDLSRPRPAIGGLVAAAIVSLAAIALAALLGRPIVSLRAILDAETGYGFWNVRLPRVALAAAAGAGLSLGGVVFQALFRNPLATPYTLGIDTGASLAAAVGMMCGVSGYWLGFPLQSLSAFCGAAAVMLLVFAASRGRAEADMTRLLLAGVCIAYLCSAGITLVLYLAGRAIAHEIMFWTMGSLDMLRPRAALEAAIAIVPLVVFVAANHRAIDLLAMGDDLARSRGVAVRRVVWGAFALVGVATAVIVSNCGPIGFVGLMVPHLVRALVGPRTLPLAVGSLLVGAGFLSLCDGVARAATIYELPVGVITNIVGAGFFFVMVNRRAG